MVCVDIPVQHSALLPYVVSWPRDASDAFFKAVCDRYASQDAFVNRFQYSILMHKAESPTEAVESLSREGVFASQAGRNALLGVIREAQNTVWCKQEILDTLERYATYAFVLDGATVTCGALPK